MGRSRIPPVRHLRPKCPNCGSADDHLIVRSPRNLGVASGNLLWYLFQFSSIIVVTHSGWPLKRKCLKCGYRFYGPTPEPPDFDECPACGYNLTGNVAGRCSECGWRLTRRYRAYRRRRDRALGPWRPGVTDRKHAITIRSATTDDIPVALRLIVALLIELGDADDKVDFDPAARLCNVFMEKKQRRVSRGNRIGRTRRRDDAR
jgi:hypothetical protein